MKIIRTDSDNPDLMQLIPLLDKELEDADGVEDHPFFAQFNKMDTIKHVLLAYEGEKPVGCGAVKEYKGDTAEIKRMFVRPEFRSQGIADKLLKELETWAQELGYRAFVLETGKTQKAAIRLYEKNGYEQIPNYGQYAGVEKSYCMSKKTS
jgi:GNAT superfamily N-acetyltransferase